MKRNNKDRDESESSEEDDSKQTSSYICENCGIRLNKKDSLVRHRRTVHGIYTRKRSKTCDILHHKKAAHESNEEDDNKQTSSYICETCGIRLNKKDSMIRHRRTVHGIYTRKRSKICDVCNKYFPTSFNMLRHKKAAHEKASKISSTFTCRHCQEIFPDYQSLFSHVEREHPLNQRGGRAATAEKTLGINTTSGGREKNDDVTSTSKNAVNTARSRQSNIDTTRTKTSSQTALNDSVHNEIILPEPSERYDLLSFFAGARTQIEQFLRARTRRTNGIKWSMSVQIELRRDDNETSVSTPYFRSSTYVLLTQDDFNEHHLNEAMQKMFNSLEKYMRDGSGWYVSKILKLEIHTVIYRPISGSSYIPLPLTLIRSRSVLNIQNRDEKCFLYCILASLHGDVEEPEDAQSYVEYTHELNMKGLSYPMSLTQINLFEKQNENISVNVFTFENGEILPLRLTIETKRLHHVNLLWLKNDQTEHYCLIKDLNTFLSRTKKIKNKTYFCNYCLHGFWKETLLKEHIEYCSIHGAQKIEIPEKGKNDILEFRDYEKTLKVPFVIYADFETINVKIQSCDADPEISSSTPKFKLEVCGFGYKVVCSDDRYTKPSVIYRGSDASQKLIESLLQEQKEIDEILSHIEPMAMTEKDLILANSATHCSICSKTLTLNAGAQEQAVRHHDHVSGKFLGMAHNSCNLNAKQTKHTCVIFHNLKKFDAHILCSSIGHFKDDELKVIPQTMENYVSFSLGKLRFIDSLQFLPSSLQKLTDDLSKDGPVAFKHFYSEFEDKDKAQMLLRKGVYMYEYMDSVDKFEESSIPPIDCFYSSLKRESVSEEDYAHAQRVFSEFNLKTLGSYHDLYLKVDVLLLCCVFERFRSVCMNSYGLDCAHFYTSPGLSWSSCLKMTGVRLELLSDIDQILFIEKGIRGGISQTSNRYKRANNPLLDDYDENQPTSYLMYLDMNNLYGWAMIQPLPFKDFKFLSEEEINDLNIRTVSQDSDLGYILECSLRCPPSIHDHTNDYPLAPEQLNVEDEWLSPYAKHVLKQLHGLKDEDALPNRAKSKKLICSLYDKEKYVLHYRNLQFYLSLGMEIKQIHRVLSFQQRAWMKSYIDYNTEMRKIARSDFEKTFWKLMNVSVFGKTMENMRKHRNIELIHRECRLLKVASKPTYRRTQIFNEELVAVELLRSKVKLFKPCYSGMCVLDLSKLIMYDFFYNYLKEVYGSDKIQLQMTDTDSLLFHCETKDFYEDMKRNSYLFDTSDYPEDHPCYSVKNKKALGRMKDETNGKPISEVVCLRSKMYSFQCGQKEIKKAKGISTIAVEKELRFQHYKDTLFKESSTINTLTSIRSHSHDLFMETSRKVGLSAFDDKRYLLNAVESYAYGHYKIAQLDTSQ